MKRFYFSLIILAALIAFPWGGNIFYSSFYISLLTRIFIYAIIVVGFDLLAGYTGMISYGHALFFGTGAYITGMILKHWTPWFWPPIFITILASGLVAYVIGFLSIRTRHIYFVFLTFAFAQFFFVTANSWNFIGASNGLSGVPKPVIFPGFSLSGENSFYYFTLAVLVAGYLLARLITQSAFGKVMVGVRENEDRTLFLGYDTRKVILRVFIISGIYGGFAGALMASFNSFVSPTLYHPAISGEIIIMALLGGMGTLVGPIIGAGLVIILGDVLSSWLAESWMMILGAVFVVVILFSPGGVVALSQKISRLLKRGIIHGHS
ncbi:MAG: branched-chain amino acid ABC transporter permease [Deltaproteobacteria bacterium]|nr:branched-chain amino acid ABC transporter permease [Deltaproteobacteria bacterium]